MIRFNSVVILSVLLLGLVVGCQNGDQADQANEPISTGQMKPPAGYKPKTPAPNPSATASPGQATTAAAPASAGKASPPAASASPEKASTPAASASPGKAKAPAAPANTVAQAKLKATPPAQPTAATQAKIKQTLAKLKGYLPAAVKALQANDVATAKKHAQGFSANWNQKIIQSTVKTQSQASYDKLSTGVTQVNNSMKPATPDKTKAIAALQSLSKSVDEYTKSP